MSGNNKTNAYYDGNAQYENTYGQQSYMPNNNPYTSDYTNSFYEEESSGVSSFLLGALVGGVIGAAAALFLAPKSGSQMREDFSTQAVQLKDKSIELGAVAKTKATEFTSVAKEKTSELTKSIQEQSEQLVGKVKSMTSKTSFPTDDGTASSEGEEAIEYVDLTARKADSTADNEDENTTATAEALKKAVVEISDSSKKD